MKYRVLRTLALAALLSQVLSSTGCTSSDAARSVQIGSVSAGCFVNSDCEAPLVCAFQRCHAECVLTRDCHGLARCVGAHEVARVCQLDIEAHCSTAADCPVGLHCGPDAACRDECATAADCVGEQQCVKGVCAEPSELDAAGALPELVPYTGCRLNSDCASGSQCASGNCVPECRADADCAAMQQCDNGACRASSELACVTGKDCLTPGADCLSGRCHCACLADIDCKIGERCDGCACHAPAPPECTTSQQCIGGKICRGGSCACACVNDRDCAAPLSCDGCSCIVPTLMGVDDAEVDTLFDIQRLTHVTEVRGQLRISGSLTSLAGLEGIGTVGSLVIDNSSLGATPLPDVSPLAGLSGLRLIRGDLEIRNTRLSSLAFDPLPKIGGNVALDSNYALSTCAVLDFRARLLAQGFTGTFIHTGQELECSGACDRATCVVAAPAAIQ